MLKLFVKDLKIVFSDKKALMIFILMPIILTTILSFALKGSFSQESATDLVKVAVVKKYDKEAELTKLKTTLSQYGLDKGMNQMVQSLDVEAMFYESFLMDEGIQRVFDIKYLNEDEAQKALEKKEVGVVVTLPEGFIYNQYVNFFLPMRNDIRVEMLQHPEYNFSGNIANSIFESYFNRLNTLWVNKAVYLELAEGKLSQDELYAKMSEVFALTESEQEKITSIEKHKTDTRRFVTSASYYAVAMMAMFILYSSSHTGREMLKERHLKTLDRNYVAGIGYGRTMMSKAGMTMTLCIVQMSLLMLYSRFALGVQWDRFDQLFVGIIFSALAVAGLGVFISAITLVNDDYKVANIFENIIVHLMALIGGSYIPVEVMPEIVGKLKGFALNGIVLDLFLDIYQGTTWDALYEPFIKLVIVGAVFIILAWIIIIRKERSDYVGDAETEV